MDDSVGVAARAVPLPTRHVRFRAMHVLPQGFPVRHTRCASPWETEIKESVATKTAYRSTRIMAISWRGASESNGLATHNTHIDPPARASCRHHTWKTPFGWSIAIHTIYRLAILLHGLHAYFARIPCATTPTRVSSNCWLESAPRCRDPFCNHGVESAGICFSGEDLENGDKVIRQRGNVPSPSTLTLGDAAGGKVRQLFVAAMPCPL